MILNITREVALKEAASQLLKLEGARMTPAELHAYIAIGQAWALIALGIGDWTRKIEIDDGRPTPT